ncbi:hypothetical protein PIB30_090343 [Stylosanthes scabra]|uniref:Uncharacterized protein n=1 Tax=Stylosanthes scabra TaxID=79078 RepID=A0ABU6UTN3_9FABA|nr:hypothetical protein [Stylosanthes scabra]
MNGCHVRYKTHSVKRSNGGINPVPNVLCVHNNVEPRYQQNSSKSRVTRKKSPWMRVHHQLLHKQRFWRQQVACATLLVAWAASACQQSCLCNMQSCVGSFSSCLCNLLATLLATFLSSWLLFMNPLLPMLSLAFPSISQSLKS